MTSETLFRIRQRPPEVQENPDAFKWVDGAWMHVIDAPEYTLSVPQKYRDAANRRWPE